MKKILLLLLAVVLIYGCKKDESFERYQLSSETVTQYISSDSTLTEQISFQYDEFNRLNTVIHNWGPQYYVETDSYRYDNGGNLISLSLSTPVQTGTYTTSYSGGYPTSTTYNLNGNTSTVYYTFENGRLVATDFGATVEYLSYNGNNYSLLSYTDGVEYLYTYGTHTSAFLYTGYKYPLWGLSYVVNDNEILSVKTINNNILTSTTVNNYTYNSTGYPSKVQEYTNGNLVNQVTFTYRKLWP
jgi:hypothetical protein